MPPRIRSVLMKLGALLVSGVLAVGVVEIALRVWAPTSSPSTYHVWPPGLERTLRPVPAVFSGISGDSRVTFNALGMRGSLLDPTSDDYQIMTIGGSTTYCDMLDDHETWPYRLELMLNETNRDQRFRVANAGKSGHLSRHHILQVPALLAQHPEVDAVIILMGVNDLVRSLAHDVHYRPYAQADDQERARFAQEAFSVFPRIDAGYPAHKRTEIWRRLRGLKSQIRARAMRNAVPDADGLVYQIWRQHRRTTPSIRQKLPDLTEALGEYTAHIHAMIDAAEAAGRRIIFVTQPVLWSKGLSKADQDLLWLGGIGEFQAEPGCTYYSVEALAEAMQLYNTTMISACQDRGVECVDLAAQLPRDTQTFYDDCHFNESGTKRVVRALADYLLGCDPFNASGRSDQESLTK